MYHFAFAYTIMVARSIAIQYSTLANLKIKFYIHMYLGVSLRGMVCVWSI